MLSITSAARRGASHARLSRVEAGLAPSRAQRSKGSGGWRGASSVSGRKKMDVKSAIAPTADDLAAKDKDHWQANSEEIKGIDRLAHRANRLDVRVYNDGNLPSYDDSIFDSMDSSEEFDKSSPMTMRKRIELRRMRDAGFVLPRRQVPEEEEEHPIPKYAGEPLPVAVSADVVATPEEVNRFYTFKNTAIQRQYPEGTPKGFLDVYSAFGHPRFMNRAHMAPLIQRMKAIERGKADKTGAVIYTGHTGVGRSTSLAHATVYARDAGWIALTLPNMTTVTRHTTLRHAEWFKGDEVLYDTPAPAYESVAAIVAAHGDVLARIPQRRRHAYGPRYRGGRNPEDAVAFAKQAAIDAQVGDVRRAKQARMARQQKLRDLASMADGDEEEGVWEDGVTLRDSEDVELLAEMRRNVLWTDDKVEAAVAAECGHLSAINATDAELDSRSKSLRGRRTSMAAVRERAAAGELEHTLLDVASAGMRDPGDASRVLLDLRMELGLVEEVPVLITCDAVNCAYEPTAFAVDNEPTLPNRLVVARTARAFDGTGMREEMRLKNGIFVAATCEDGGRRKHFYSEVPVRKFQSRVPPLNAAEARAICAAAADAGVFHSYLSDNHCEWLRTTASGLPKQMLRDMATGVEQRKPPPGMHDQYTINMKELRRMERHPWPPVHPVLRKRHSDMADLTRAARLAEQISVGTQLMVRSHMGLWTARVKAAGRTVPEQVVGAMRAKQARETMMRFGHTREFDREKELKYGDHWNETTTAAVNPEREADRKAAFKRALADAREVARRRDALMERVSRREAEAMAEIEVELTRLRNLEVETLGALRAAAAREGGSAVGEDGELLVAAVEKEGRELAARRRRLMDLQAKQLAMRRPETELMERTADGTDGSEGSNGTALTGNTDQSAGPSATGPDRTTERSVERTGSAAYEPSAEREAGYSVEDLPDTEARRLIARPDMSRAARAARSEAARTAVDWALERDAATRPAQAAAFGVGLDDVEAGRRVAEATAREAAQARALVEDLRNGRVPEGLRPEAVEEALSELESAAADLECDSSELWELDQAATRAEMVVAARREMNITSPVASTDALRKDAVRLAEYRNRVDRFAAALANAGVPTSVSTLAIARTVYANAAAVEEELIWSLVGKNGDGEAADADTAAEVSRLLSQHRERLGETATAMADSLRLRSHRDLRISDPDKDEMLERRYTRLSTADDADIRSAAFAASTRPEEESEAEAEAYSAEQEVAPEDEARDRFLRAYSGARSLHGAGQNLSREERELEQAHAAAAQAARRSASSAVNMPDRLWSGTDVAQSELTAAERARWFALDAAAQGGLTPAVAHARGVGSMGGYGHRSAAEAAAAGLGLDPATVMADARMELRRRMAGGDAEKGSDRWVTGEMEERPVFETLAGAIDNPVSMLSTKLLSAVGAAEDALRDAQTAARRVRGPQAEAERAAAVQARDKASQALVALSAAVEEEAAEVLQWRREGMPSGSRLDEFAAAEAGRLAWSDARVREEERNSVLGALDVAMRRVDEEAAAPAGTRVAARLDELREAQGKRVGDRVEKVRSRVWNAEEYEYEYGDDYEMVEVKGTSSLAMQLRVDLAATMADAVTKIRASGELAQRSVDSGEGLEKAREYLSGLLGTQAFGHEELMLAGTLEDIERGPDYWVPSRGDDEDEIEEFNASEKAAFEHKFVEANELLEVSKAKRAYREATRASLFSNVRGEAPGPDGELAESRKEAAQMVMSHVEPFGFEEVVASGDLTRFNRLVRVEQAPNDYDISSEEYDETDEDTETYSMFEDPGASIDSKQSKMVPYLTRPEKGIRVSPVSKGGRLRRKFIKEKEEEYEEFHNDYHPGA